VTQNDGGRDLGVEGGDLGQRADLPGSDRPAQSSAHSWHGSLTRNGRTYERLTERRRVDGVFS